MALIETHELQRFYRMGGSVIRALDGVDVTVEQGKFVAVVGPSGSGKSTFVGLLGCLDRPTAGCYRFNGLQVDRLGGDELASIRGRNIGFVFQTFELLPRATALENVELPLVYQGVPPRERRARAGHMLELVGLGDRLHHLPSQLSGGQQQRVAIARSVAGQPLLLLADEPTGALDTATGGEIVMMLRHLNRDRGLTVVLVTHEPEIAACADEILFFCDGRLVRRQTQCAPPC